MKEGEREPPRPPAASDLELALHRCPYCHDGVDVAEQATWVSCAGCLARHHRACWDEAGRCASCRDEAHLAPARRAGRAPLLLGLALLLLLALGIALGAWLSSATEAPVARPEPDAPVARPEPDVPAARPELPAPTAQPEPVVTPVPTPPAPTPTTSPVDSAREALDRAFALERDGDFAGADAALAALLERDLGKLDLAEATFARARVRALRGDRGGATQDLLRSLEAGEVPEAHRVFRLALLDYVRDYPYRGPDPIEAMRRLAGPEASFRDGVAVSVYLWDGLDATVQGLERGDRGAEGAEALCLVRVLAGLQAERGRPGIGSAEENYAHAARVPGQEGTVVATWAAHRARALRR